MRLGKITENALKRSVLKQLKTEFKSEASAVVGMDCAFSENGKTFSTISPVTVDVSDCGFYGVVKAVNGLVSQGIKPEQVVLSILLPEDVLESTLKKIVGDAIEAARLCGAVYSGGHTEVTNAVNRPICTVSALGTANTQLHKGKGLAGQTLVITKWIGLEGTNMLAEEKFAELTKKYPVPFIDEARDFRDLLFVGREIEIIEKNGLNVGAIHDLSNGGVFAGLWELAQKSGCGLKVDLKSIPIRQETVEICEFFEINPYQLISGGALLIATDDGEKLVSTLAENGIYSAIVGELSNGNDRIIVNSDESRFLEMPQADEILKVFS